MNNIITNLIIHYGVGYAADVASTFLRRAEYRPSESEARAARSIQCLSNDSVGLIGSFLTESERMNLFSMQKAWRPLYLQGRTVLLTDPTTDAFYNDRIQFAIRNKLKMKYSNFVSPSMETLLHYTVSKYNLHMVKALIENGADVNATNKYGDTPLLCLAISLWCYRNKKIANQIIMNMLLKSGANSNSCTSEGKTALHYAGLGGAAVNQVEILLNNGANINLKDDQGQTPLWYAVKRCKIETTKLFIEKGANPNFEDFFYAVNFYTPLEEYVELFNIFLEKWAIDINAQDENGDTLLHFAACCQHSAPITELVLAKGAKVNVQNKRGMTPLHEAVIRGCGKTATLLVESEADINAKNNEGKTPLNYARFGRTEVSTILLKNGAKD